MMYIVSGAIDLDMIAKYKDELIRFSNMEESDIQNIWISDNEIKLEDLSKIKYSYDNPWYQKMIFQFRGDHLSPICFFNCIDKYNQKKLLRYFAMDNTCFDIMNFFVWINSKYGLTIHVDEDNKIKFFFDLPDNEQILLINNYNEYVYQYHKYLNS